MRGIFIGRIFTAVNLLFCLSSASLIEEYGDIALLDFHSFPIVRSGILNEITDTDAILLRYGGGKKRQDQSERGYYNITDFFLRLQQNSYDTRVRPNVRQKPVTVSCSIFVNSISSISEINMDFTVDFYFRQTWRDGRLAWFSQGQLFEDSITLSGDYFAALWRPDSFVVNEKKSSFHYVTGLNSFIRIMPDGHVTQSYRLTIRASCQMHFKFFPLDHQKCPLFIESYSLPMEDMRYIWYRTKSAQINTEAASFSSDASSLLHYVIHGYRTLEGWAVREDSYNHSRLLFEIYLARDLGYYVIQIYIPASLIVIISWISFWVPRNSAPARVTLGVTTVLTMVTFTSHGFKAGLPHISYLKAMDIYMLASFFMVFAALLEYAVVSYTEKRIKSCEAAMKGLGSSSSDDDDDEDETGEKTSSDAIDYDDDGNEIVKDLDEEDVKSSGNNTSSDSGDYIPCECYLPHRTPSTIEWLSRFVFPVSFALFNFLYWNHYLNNELDDTESDPGFVGFELG